MGDLWVFAYGSLMWRPDFLFENRVPAMIFGLHRALCIYSHVHRGSPRNPGLVLGLDHGGACHGVAFRVAASRRERTLAYLRAREQVTMVYRESLRRITLCHGERTPVEAVVYLADRSHRQYAGRLPRHRQLALVRRGVGQSGTNRDYVLNTAAHLREMGISDPRLDWIAAELLREQADPPHR